MNIKDLTKQAIIAAVYTAISLALLPFTFGALQFRVAEALMVLPFYNKKHTVGLTIGCLITNMFSHLGLVDVVFGTLATLIVCLLVGRLRRTRFIAVAAAVVNGVIVGFMLYFVANEPLVFSMATVAASEFVVVQLGVFMMAAVNKTQAILEK